MRDLGLVYSLIAINTRAVLCFRQNTWWNFLVGWKIFCSIYKLWLILLKVIFTVVFSFRICIKSSTNRKKECLNTVLQILTLFDMQVCKKKKKKRPSEILRTDTVQLDFLTWIKNFKATWIYSAKCSIAFPFSILNPKLCSARCF